MQWIFKECTKFYTPSHFNKITVAIRFTVFICFSLTRERNSSSSNKSNFGGSSSIIDSSSNIRYSTVLEAIEVLVVVVV